MNELDEMLWPADLESRQKMARALFGLEIIGDTDYSVLLAEDEIDDTSAAPWARPDNKSSPERREVFSTLKPEQREAVRELLRETMRRHLHFLCLTLDRTLGGTTIVLEQPTDGYGDPLRIHSSEQDELIQEKFRWLEDFSIIFGEDERGGEPA